MSDRPANNLRAAAEAFLSVPANLALMQYGPDFSTPVEKEFPAEATQWLISDDEDELQLHEDEGTQKKRIKLHHYDADTKLEAIKWAREKKSARSGGEFNIKSAAQEFNVDRKCVRNWIKQEGELKQKVNSSGGGRRKKLDGGGRHVSHPDLDLQMAEWIRKKREKKQPVSCKIIMNQANDLYRGKELLMLDGSASSFSATISFCLD